MTKINLTKKEYDYLITMLLKNHKGVFSQISSCDNNTVNIDLEDDDVRMIRKLVIDKISSLNKSNETIETIRNFLIDILDKLYKIKVKVNLTREEYDYLINNLLKSHKEMFSKLKFSENNENSIDVHLEEDVADNIRELVIDEIGMDYFDENYEPTKEGWILEHFIDKFYFEDK
jgi:FKBP-type peptidyl-prolyl cis-trans isomerase (trigger factor)